MKRAQPHVKIPASKSERAYLAKLPPRFWMVLKDFDSYAEHNRNGYGPADYLRKGDICLGGGSIHQTKVRIASPTKPTHYCLLGHGMMNEHKAEGFVRPLTLSELLKVIPHMTNLIWRCEGQYALRDMVCALPGFPPIGTPDKAWILRKYFV